MGKADVSGNAVRGATTVIVQFQLPSDRAPHQYRFLHLHLRANSVVDNVSIAFDYGDPGKASTVEDYDRSGLFDLLSPLLPDGCMGRDKLALYRFFNDIVKPTIAGPSRDTYSGVYSAGDQYQYRSKRVSFCSVYIDYRKDSGFDTSMIDEGHPTGRFTSIEVILWMDPSPFK